MKHRFLPFFLALLTLFQLTFISLPTPAAAAAPAKVTTTSATASPGETDVSVTISLSDNPGICGMILRISYDKRLTLANVEKGAALSTLTLAEFAVPYINPLNASWDGVRADNSNGTLLTLTFDVPADAEAGVYNVTVSYNEGDVYDDDLNDLSLDVSSGSITVQGRAAHTHTLTHTPAKEATCTEAGCVEHWTCEDCGKTFSDEAGETEIPRADIPKDPSNHTGGTEIRNQKDPTETRDGYTGDVYCKSCGRKIRTGEAVPATGDKKDKDKNEDKETPKPTPAETTPTPEQPEKWTNPFTDISESDSYYDAVRYVYENNLFKGVAEDRFAPDTTMTRAMFVTVLGRLAGVDTTAFTGSSFDDATPGEWYSPYVEWAAKFEIVKGYGDGKFGVNNTITIEQAAVIMARYAEYMEINTTSTDDLTTYRDSANVSSWAENQMKWAVENGIYTGEGTALTPQSPAKRSLVAEIIYNFTTKYGK